MLAQVDTELEEPLHRALDALQYLLASTQPDARKWEGVLRHHIGWALARTGRRLEALSQFERALSSLKLVADAPLIRTSQWAIAWTYRILGRTQAALDIQLAFEAEWHTNGRVHPEVYEELEHLYRVLENPEREAHYA